MKRALLPEPATVFCAHLVKKMIKRKKEEKKEKREKRIGKQRAIQFNA